MMISRCHVTSCLSSSAIMHSRQLPSVRYKIAERAYGKSHVTSTGLDSAAKPFEDVLKQKLKDSAVKQEVEKLAEMQRAALRTMASLLPLASETMTPRFNSLVDEIKGSALWGADFKEMFANISESKATQNGTEMDID